jgi:hypothetical protein
VSAFGPQREVRVAIVAARSALPVWERHEPHERAPHERIEAAEAWLACPCREHADAAGDLAFANGTDNPLKGWTVLRIGGRSIESMGAIYAHWASDNACSAAYAFESDSLGEVVGTGFGAAVEAWADDGSSSLTHARRIANAIADDLAPFASERALGARPIPPTSIEMPYDGPPLSERHTFAVVARRILAVLGAGVDTPRVTVEADSRDGARVDVYRFEGATGRVELRVAPGPRWSCILERRGGPRVIIDAETPEGAGGSVKVEAPVEEAQRVARALRDLY